MENAPRKRRLMGEINVVPLIDVMLVLLVIFIITAPLLTHAVKIDLPRASSQPNLTRPDNIQLGIKANGEIYWNGELIDEAALAAHLQASAALAPQPEMHIRAEKTTEYQRVAKVMSEAAKHGLTRIGFVTDPSQR